MNDAERIARMNEWVDVRRKGGHKINKPSTGSPAALDPEATLESVTSLLMKQTKTWQQCLSREQIIKLLERLYIFEGEPITKAVCLAIGSFSRVNLENRRRSIAQLAFFLDVVDHISKKPGSKISMYAQDPQFTSVDHQLLHSLDIEVLPIDTPTPDISKAAQQHFGKSSFVAEFYLAQSPLSTAQLLCQDIRLLITTVQGQIERFQSNPAQVEQGNELKGIMDRCYSRYAFPYSDSQDFVVFEGLNLLGRVPDDDAAVE